MSTAKYLLWHWAKTSSRYSYGLKIFGAVVLLLSLLACSNEELPEIGCEDTDQVEVFCGFTNPEDIEPVPGGRYLIISEMQFTDPKPSVFSQFDMSTNTRTVLDISRQPQAGWGDANCPAPASLGFAPHGIRLSQRPDGALQLLAVSHYPREAVEVFEAVVRPAGVKLIWHGCLIPPGKPFLNDVTSAPDGTVLITHMREHDTSDLMVLISATLGLDTGYVWSWSAAQGYQRVPGSEGEFPNGITMSDHPDVVFVNYYLGNQLKALNFRTGEILKTYEVMQPDNSFLVDGQLYVPSHEHGLVEGLSLCANRTTNCPMPYAIHRIDTKTFEGKRVFSYSGAPFGATSVGVPLNGWFWMGSYLGDRIARVPLSALAK